MTWVLVLAATVCAPPAELHHFEITSDRSYRVGELPLQLRIRAVDAKGETLTGFCGPAQLTGLSRRKRGTWSPLTNTGPLTAGQVVLSNVRLTGDHVSVSAGSIEATWRPDLRQLPGWLSIVPPLLAVLLAIFLRQALLALLASVWIGALIIHGFHPFTALFRLFDTYLLAAVVPVDKATGQADTGHAAIILFTMALGGMVGIISRSGATRSLVDAIAARARSRRSGMLTAWISGLVVFFDDYANCLLVGNTVRPFTDRQGISREKLSYIVDSTAAPVATVALVSTWIGYQIGLFEEVLGDHIGPGGGYDLFLDILPYSFYSFFTIAFVFLIAITLRDFGPMRRAELRAAHEGLVLRDGAKPLMDRELTEMESAGGRRAGWPSALVPVAAVIGIVAVGLYVNGAAALGPRAQSASLREIIAEANSYAVLLWASFGGSLVALLMVIAGRSLSLSDAVDGWVAGAKAMTMAVLILVLAWALGAMCKDHLQTGEWLLSHVSPSPHWLPLITFVICGSIAFATGSSFSTMAIVIPIAGPMAFAVTGDGSGLAPDVIWSIRHATLAAVLGGAVFGDHCSPISDTTIMSSMSSAADHVDHVKTQIPYALVCAGAAGALGYIPAGFGVSPAFTVPAGIALLAGLVFVIGRKIGPAPADTLHRAKPAPENEQSPGPVEDRPGSN